MVLRLWVNWLTCESVSPEKVAAVQATGCRSSRQFKFVNQGVNDRRPELELITVSATVLEKCGVEKSHGAAARA